MKPCKEPVRCLGCGKVWTLDKDGVCPKCRIKAQEDKRFHILRDYLNNIALQERASKEKKSNG